MTMTVEEMAEIVVRAEEAGDPRANQLYMEVARRARMSPGEARFRIYVLAMQGEVR